MKRSGESPLRAKFHGGRIKAAWFYRAGLVTEQRGATAARDAGMEYTTRLRDVVDLRSGEKFPARSLVYSVRNSWRRATSLAWNAALRRALTDQPLLRLSIHPPDYSHPAIWRQIVDLIRCTWTEFEHRRPISDWIAEQRAQGAPR